MMPLWLVILLTVAAVIMLYEAFALWITHAIPTVTSVVQAVLRHFSPACHDIEQLRNELRDRDV